MGRAQRAGDGLRGEAHFVSLLAVLPSHVRRVDWPRERLDAHREERLRALVRAAKEGSPWHRERLRDVDPDALRLGDLASLPVMTKSELLAHYDDAVTDRRLTRERLNAHVGGQPGSYQPGSYLFGRYRVTASAGSSGERAVFAYDWSAWRAVQAGNTRMLARDRLRQRDLRRGRVAVIGSSHPWHRTAGTFARSPLVTSIRIPVSCARAEMIARLEALRPRTLAGFPSMMGELAQEALAGRLRIAPARVVVSGEPLTAAVREAIGEAWGARIANVWACTEAGPLAAGCFESEGMHLNEDLVIVEAVDEQGRPVPPGTRAAKVLVTNLENHAVPILRYELTDQVRLLEEPCPCGSRLARVADIEGRLDDLLELEGTRVHPSVFRSPLTRDAAVIEYQVIQRPRGAEILVRLRAETDLAAIERAITRELRGLGIARPDVHVRAVPSIGRADGGKVKRFIPLTA